MWSMDMELQKSVQVCEAQANPNSVQTFQASATPRKQRYTGVEMVNAK